MRLMVIIALLGVQLFAQTPVDTYYSSISTSSPTFVSDLQNRIRSPYTRVSYDQFDETNIAKFASRDTTGGKKVVTCVYSGQNYVYTPPFTWTVFSREHTWCQSWFPTGGSTSTNEGSDQHHLFPTNQNSVNGVRSNHPLGNVTTVISSFLEGKFGTNALGQTVYEPRNSHKGDAARALLYMSLRYNGVGGYDWTFNHLNTVTLPSLNEAPQDLNLLIQWSENDPPDAWEIARNDYVQSIQGNRNPFVDHPEYINYINFNKMSYNGSLSLATEPANYVTNFTIGNTTSGAMQLIWTDAAVGSQTPSGYLIIASTSSSITGPADGVVYPNDLDLADGLGKANVDYSAADNYTFSNLTSNTQYYYKIFSYYGSGTSINYKTDGTVPSVNDKTLTSVNTTLAAGDILIIGFNMDDPDEFAFVPLVDLESGKTIYFTDNGWLSSGAFRSGEGTLTWTAPGGGVTAGTIISVATTTSSMGSIVSSGSFALSASGDQILAYTGTASAPVFLYALNDSGASWQASALSSNSSALPNGLTNGISAVALNENDNAIFAGAISSDYVQLRQNVGDKLNWTGSNTVRQIMPSGKWSSPVELKNFSASYSNGAVYLKWQTATELNNSGFEVQKSKVKYKNSKIESVWEKVVFIPGAGTSIEPNEYAYRDNVVAPVVYLYRLKQIDNGGTNEFSKEVEVNCEVQMKFHLEQNYPNPFNPTTSIQYTVVSSQHVTLKVYNVIGKEEVVLVNEKKEPGTYTVDFSVSTQASGIYFYRLQAGTFVQTKKMILLK